MVPLFLGGLDLLSCGKSQPPGPPAEKPLARSGPALLPLAEIPFPEWSAVEEEKFIELPKPAGEPVLQWGFSKDRIAYEALQKIDQHTESLRGDKVAKLDATDRNRGTFEFLPARERTADVHIWFHTEEASRNGIQASPQEIRKNPTTKIDAVAKEDGTAEIRKPAGHPELLFFFDSLLALGLGERKVRGGWVRTRAAGFAKVEHYECVRLETEFEFSPTAALGAMRQRGRTIGYFAAQERRFVRISCIVTTSTRTKEQEAGGAWVLRKFDSTTTLRLKILENP